MKPTSNQVVGDLGETEVDANFQRIGWAPSIKFRQDIGDDHITVARDARGNDLGLPVVYQVKSSWTEYQKPDDSLGEDDGWWFADSDPRHFDHWVKYGLPQLLVLHDLTSRTSYWVHVTGDRVASTGKGSKIFVPAHQKVDRDHLDNLVAVAASTRSRIALEGSAWSGALADIGPSDRLRYALIAPRLIAPHGNQHHETLTAAQGLALISGVRLEQYQRAAMEGSAPKPEAMREHREWAWQFAGALYDVLLGEGCELLLQLISEASHPHEVTAARVVAACWYWEDEKYDAACAMLLPVENASDADAAWILTQRARVLVSLERVDEAIEAAQSALERLALLTSDVTASSLRSSAVWTLYNASAFGQGDLGQAVSASDNAVTWWRSQQVLRGLTYATEDAFEYAFKPMRTVYRTRDRGHNHLTGALWNAAFAADQIGWRNAAKSLALHGLMAREADDEVVLKSSLSLLRRGGHYKELGNAVVRLWETGPTHGLSVLASARSVCDQTYEEERATLAIWKGAGDLLSREDALTAITDSLRLIEPPNSVARSPSGGATLRTHDVVPAVLRLLPAAGPEAWLLVASYLADHLSRDANTAQSLRPLLKALPLQNPALAVHVETIREQAKELDNYQGHLVLAHLAPHDAVARTEMDRLADAGSDLASATRASLGDASQEEMRAFLEVRKQLVVDLIARSEELALADEHEQSIGGPDPLEELVWISTRLGAADGFDIAFRALASPVVSDEDKEQALWRFISSFGDLPSEVRAQIPARLLPGGRSVTSDQGISLALSAVTGMQGPYELHTRLMRLMRSHSDGDRSSAALAIGYAAPSDALTLLTAAMVDSSASVRATAASCVVHVGTANVRLRAHAEQMLATVLDEDGFLVARTVAQCLSHETETYMGLRAVLSQNPSALVRSDLSSTEPTPQEHQTGPGQEA